MTSAARIEKGLYWDEALTLVDGCTEVDLSCKFCWSRTITALWRQDDGLTTDYDHWSNTIIPRTDKLSKLLPKKPRTYAIWNDLFHESVPEQFIHNAIEFMRVQPHHTFIVLTKRPSRIRNFSHSEYFSGIPDNVWLGTSIPTQKFLFRANILMKIPCRTRILSIEPMLDYVDLADTLAATSFDNLSPAISWVICGCESGARRRKPQLPWLEKIIENCIDANTPLFLKQWDFDGRVEHLPAFNGRTWAQFPST